MKGIIKKTILVSILIFVALLLGNSTEQREWSVCKEAKAEEINQNVQRDYWIVCSSLHYHWKFPHVKIYADNLFHICDDNERNHSLYFIPSTFKKNVNNGILGETVSYEVIAVEENKNSMEPQNCYIIKFMNTDKGWLWNMPQMWLNGSKKNANEYHFSETAGWESDKWHYVDNSPEDKPILYGYIGTLVFHSVYQMLMEEEG